MLESPFKNHEPRTAGQFSRQHRQGLDIERGSVLTIFGVKMWTAMLPPDIVMTMPKNTLTAGIGYFPPPIPTTFLSVAAGLPSPAWLVKSSAALSLARFLASGRNWP